MKANIMPVEVVYTEDDWVKHMERNGKRLFKRWLRKQMIAWCKVIIAVTIILGCRKHARRTARFRSLSRPEPSARCTKLS